MASIQRCAIRRGRASLVLLLLACSGNDTRPAGADSGPGTRTGADSDTDTDPPGAARDRKAAREGDGVGGSVEPLECPQRSHMAGRPGCLTADAFDADVVRSYELRVDASDLRRMALLARSEETENTYVPADLVVDGEEIGMVGLRFKGAFGTLQTCIGENDELLCDKMSYKVKFNAFDEDKRWKALKKVNLHSMRVDDTLMHEHLAYKLFREMGIAAPRATHAQVSVNGENKGVFALTEAPDGRFTADRFAPAGDGNLYKEIWPVSTDAEEYAAQLETNEDEVRDHRPFIAFATALKQADPRELPEVVDRFADADYLLRYLAVDRLISNWDGVTSFYCWSPDPTYDCANHNYYWYVDEPGQRFWLVPWDLDGTWSLQTDHETIMPPWNEVPADCKTRVDRDGGFMMPPGCDPLFRGLGGLGPKPYRAAVAALLDGPFQVAALHAEIDRIANLITPAVMADPTIEFSVWQAHVQELKQIVTWLHEKGELTRDGKQRDPWGLRVDARNDFEGTAGVSFAMGSTLDPNPTTLALRSLNQRAPLHGSADARVDFTYRTGKTPYAWLNFWLSFQDSPVNLDRFTRMRVTLAADQRREVRIELDVAEDEPSREDRPAWSMAAETELRTITLDFQQLGSRPGNVAGLMIQVDAKGLDDDGFFPAGGSDRGFLQVDDIELLAD